MVRYNTPEQQKLIDDTREEIRLRINKRVNKELNRRLGKSSISYEDCLVMIQKEI